VYDEAKRWQCRELSLSGGDAVAASSSLAVPSRAANFPSDSAIRSRLALPMTSTVVIGYPIEAVMAAPTAFKSAVNGATEAGASALPQPARPTAAVEATTMTAGSLDSPTGADSIFLGMRMTKLVVAEVSAIPRADIRVQGKCGRYGTSALIMPAFLVQHTWDKRDHTESTQSWSRRYVSES
jgi:hypothetical protein